MMRKRWHAIGLAVGAGIVATTTVGATLGPDSIDAAEHGSTYPTIATFSDQLTLFIPTVEDFDLLVEDNWEWLFREQLHGWMRDPESWPDELTREMFFDWFDCELSTMIWDMLNRIFKPLF